jgi:ABC-type branched-subunit amino acid transport system substrate-binding protein
MPRRLAWLSTLLSLSLVVPGCAAQTGSKEPIKIGVAIEQTGTFAELGLAELNALRIVAEDINREGGVLGRDIELVVRDNRSDAAESKKQVTELIENEKVVGIVGSGLTATTAPFLDLVE